MPDVRIVAPGEVVAADVYCPCAKGGEIDENFHMAVRAICGAANNQLTDDAVAGVLFRKGIVYVPDFAANGGGLISVVAEQLNMSREWAWQRTRAIGTRIDDVLAEAAVRECCPLQVTQEVCERNRQQVETSLHEPRQSTIAC